MTRPIRSLLFSPTVVAAAALVALACGDSTEPGAGSTGVDGGSDGVVDGGVGGGEADQESGPVSDDDVAAMAALFSGGYTTAEQHDAHPEYTLVSYHACPIRVVDESDAPVEDGRTYLYEQRRFFDRPVHHQRFFSLGLDSEQTSVVMAIYRTPDDPGFLGFCRRPEEERVISAADLMGEPCRQFYTPDGENYIGTTGADGCPSSFMGATSIKSDAIVFSDEVIHVWGRFFDGDEYLFGPRPDVDMPFIYRRWQGPVEENPAY